MGAIQHCITLSPPTIYSFACLAIWLFYKLLTLENCYFIHK